MGDRAEGVVNRLRRELEAAREEAKGLQNSYEEQRRRLDKVSDELDRERAKCCDLGHQLEESESARKLQLDQAQLIKKLIA